MHNVLIVHNQVQAKAIAYSTALKWVDGSYRV